jgi:hypothetical protein
MSPRKTRAWGGKLKKLIRFAKAWKYYRKVPISSFYLELRITKWMEEEDQIVYDIDMASIFRSLDACKLAAIRDPKGISGLIHPCRSSASKEDALSKLARAKRRAENALAAREAGKTKKAFEWWDLVFAGKFPSYYY